MFAFIARVLMGQLPEPTNRRERLVWWITWQPHGIKDRLIISLVCGALPVAGWYIGRLVQ